MFSLLSSRCLCVSVVKTTMIEIQTPRLTLRSYTSDDLDLIAGLYADAEVTASTKLGQLSRAQSEDNLNAYLSTWSKFGFGVCAAFDRVSGEYVGESGLFERESQGDLALRYIIAKEFWGKGLAFEAAHAVIDHAFRAMDIDRVLAFVEGPNKASHHIARKLGFTEEGSMQIAKCMLYRYALSADAWSRRQ